MCTPLIATGLSFALGAGSAVLNHQAQAAQVRANNEAKAQNDANAIAAMRDEYASINNKDQQEYESATEEKTQNAIKAQKARSSATVAAGEAGVTGLSVENVLADFYSQENRQQTALDTNYDWTRNYLQGERDSAKNTAQSRIKSMRYQKGPSLLGLALGVGTAGVNSYTNYRRWSNG